MLEKKTDMQSDSNLIIRTMMRSEVDWAVDQAGNEGWNPGMFDAEYFYQTDLNGFIIAIRDGKPIACISAVSYENQFGFIGFYIVIPELRGQGYGQRIWQAAEQKLAGQNTGLDAIIAQEPTYQKAGFKTVYRNYRFENTAFQAPEQPSPEVVELQRVPLETIIQYDRQCFPAKRRRFLRGWRQMPGSTGLGYLKSNQLKGYGVIRQCREGYKIGPLFADSPDIANTLYLSLIARIETGARVYLDIPEVNLPALAMAERYGMKEVFATARMYSQAKPDLSYEKIFGVTTFELG
jgi:GNAT superfamily N-acetyltransferase